MEMMEKMMTEQMKVQDRIFFESGGNIENDDFEASLLYYCSKDREVQMAMQQYMMQMRGAMPGYWAARDTKEEGETQWISLSKSLFSSK